MANYTTRLPTFSMVLCPFDNSWLKSFCKNHLNSCDERSTVFPLIANSSKSLSFYIVLQLLLWLHTKAKSSHQFTFSTTDLPSFGSALTVLGRVFAPKPSPPSLVDLSFLLSFLFILFATVGMAANKTGEIPISCYNAAEELYVH